MFDATTQAVADTAFIHLKGLDGTQLQSDGKPVGIRIYGPGSDVFADMVDRQTARMKQRAEENDEAYVGTSSERRKEQAEDLASITADFVNLGYSPAGAAQGTALYQAFYADRKLGHLTHQVVKAMNNWGKFAPAPSGS